MDESYLTCEVGQNQSPVAIDKAIHSPELHNIRFVYHTSNVKVSLLDDKVLRLSLVNENKIHGPGGEWVLKDILIHVPSEHTIKGIKYDVEIQLRHEDKKKKRMNISVFAKEGAFHKDLARVISAASRAATGGAASDTLSLSGIDLRSFLPYRKNYYMYQGSETTPPCKEGVLWVLLKKPISLASKHIDLMEKHFAKTSRPQMPLGVRIPLVH